MCYDVNLPVCMVRFYTTFKDAVSAVVGAESLVGL